MAGWCGAVGGEGARERCRRCELRGERGAKEGVDDGTCSGSCDDGSWAEGGYGMAVRVQGGEKGERTRWDFE